jgi:glycosyltransferase involved in cell wall biosynthesis
VLRQNVPLIERAIEDLTSVYEIIIAEDGSVDGSPEVCEELRRNNGRIRHLHSSMRVGKGLALKRAFNVAKGDIILFIDADLSASLERLPDAVKLIEDGYEMVIGSRYIDGASVNRPLIRTVASKSYNRFVNLLFRDGVLDHQCGFKLLKRASFRAIMSGIKDNNFFFDTELIVRAKREKLKIVEWHVDWDEPKDRDSKVKLLRDGLDVGIRALVLRARLLKRS